MVSETEMDLLSKVGEVLSFFRYELMVFLAAVVVQFILFGNVLPRKSKQKPPAARPKEERERGEDILAQALSQGLETTDPSQIEDAFRVACEKGDHRQVLRCWAAAKRCDTAISIPLAQVAESLQRFKKDPQLILKEFRAYFRQFPPSTQAANTLLEPFAKRLDTGFVERYLELLQTVGVKKDGRTYEILIAMYFTTRNFNQVRSLAQEMTAEEVPFSVKATIAVIKTALKTGDFDEAKKRFRNLKASWTSNDAADPSASVAPRLIVSQLVEMACKESQLEAFFPELEGVPLSEESVVTMLGECARLKNTALVSQVEQLARKQELHFSDAIYAALVKCSGGNMTRVQQLLQQATANQREPSPELSLAILAVCAQTSSISTADALYDTLRTKTLPIISGFIRFYAEVEQFDKACQIYEAELQPTIATADATDADGKSVPRRALIDARMERCIMNAALRSGRSELAKTFLDGSPSDIARHVTMIRNCAAENNLEGAFSVFQTLEKNGTELNSVVYNTVLDACVECRDLVRAESWMARMKEAGMADVVTYNTLIKAYVQQSTPDLKKARALIEEMRAANIQPNRVTFNELVNAMVSKGGGRFQAWEILDEMMSFNLKPNKVTCSILLKSLGPESDEREILRTMDLVNGMDEPMDEILLSSIVEACVRIGKPALLDTKLKQLMHGGVSITGSHTFGSLIKAYGHAKDMDGVWRCWRELRSRHVRPTSITLGCMVEAVVTNGDPEGAWELIHQMEEDEQCRGVLNAVIYCSVLKGFTREKRIEQVWAVYQEMQGKHMDLSVVTFNTLLDACARCARIEHFPEILEDMKKANIRPNLITYSTMVKGHCQVGDVRTAFAIMEEMMSQTSLRPDEIMYNSLLDGCAQGGLVDEGLRVLTLMEDEGVRPSNFTLSVLVKLMSRARKLEQAYELVEQMCQKHHIKPNAHVYANLVQACCAGRQITRGLQTMEEMVERGVQPDARTYSMIIRACMSQNMYDRAMGLTRAALFLQGALPQLARFPAVAACPGIDYSVVNEVLSGSAGSGQPQVVEAAVLLMAEIRRHHPRLRIDPVAQSRVMAASVGEALPPASPSNYSRSGGAQGKGSTKGGAKGKGKGGGKSQQEASSGYGSGSWRGGKGSG